MIPVPAAAPEIVGMSVGVPEQGLPKLAVMGITGIEGV
jgi:hypothetical protein